MKGFPRAQPSIDGPAMRSLCAALTGIQRSAAPWPECGVHGGRLGVPHSPGFYRIKCRRHVLRVNFDGRGDERVFARNPSFLEVGV